MQQLEMIMDSYQSRVSEQRQQTYLVVGDLERLSSSALYSGSGPAPSGSGPAPLGSGNSGFNSASNFGLGPGIAKETDFGYVERYLPPHKDEVHGNHINLGSYLPGNKKPFLNLHIDLDDK